MTIVAEIGQNFCGDINLAKRLILMARDGGADLCKFQLYSHDKLYKDHPEIPNVELSFDQSKELFDYGTQVGIEVFFSVFDVDRVKWCEEIGVKRYKIACNMRDRNVWQAISSTGKPSIISVNRIGNLDFPYGLSCTSLIYCPSGYPQSNNDLMLSDMISSYIQGFSDHTVGIEASQIALARGARIIEKHFCLNHCLGIDAAWSMDINELRELKNWETLCKQVL